MMDMYTTPGTYGFLGLTDLTNWLLGGLNKNLDK